MAWQDLSSSGPCALFGARREAAADNHERERDEVADGVNLAVFPSPLRDLRVSSVHPQKVAPAFRFSGDGVAADRRAHHPEGEEVDRAQECDGVTQTSGPRTV